MTVKLSIPASLLIAGSVGRQTIGSLGSSEDSTTGSLKKPTFSERHPKAVRSVTVIGYLFCVSLAAILLSAYYVVFWKPSTKPEKSNAHINTTNLPCRAVTYIPSENGGMQYVPQYHRFNPSRRTHSTFPVYMRPPSLAPQPPAPVVPPPSKLALVSNNFESVQHSSSSNNSSLQRNNSAPFGPTSTHNENDSPTTRASVEEPFPEQHQVQASYESKQGVADSTFVPNPSSPSPNSIIIQKLLYNSKSVIQQQQTHK